jgi:Zn-dependent protease
VFGRRVTLFELFSFKVRVDLSWLLLAALITWGLAAGYFPATAPGLEAAAYWSMGFAGFIGLAASIVAHEMAHALVARRYGMPIRGITLFLFGGIAEMEEEPNSPRGEAMVAIAGPLMSLAVGIACFGAGIALAHPGLAPDPLRLVAPVLSYLAFINGLLVAFNLVPAFPLDGGRVLRAALWGWKGDVVWATRIAGRMGAWLGLLLMAGGVYELAMGSAVGGVWWVLIGLFVRAAARAAVYQQEQRSRFHGERVRRFAEAHPVTVAPELPLNRLVEDCFEAYYLAGFPVIAEDGRLTGRVLLAKVKTVPPERWPDLTVADVMEPCPAEALVQADAEAASAYGRMRAGGRRQLLVVQGERLVGLVRLVSLQNYLAMNRRLQGRDAANDDVRRRSGGAAG